MPDDKLDRRIIADGIARDRVGRKLTPQAQERATEHAMKHLGGGHNWGQLTEIGIKHVTGDILKDG